MLFILSSTELYNFSFFLVRYIKTDNNLITSKVHLYACFLKLSQLSLSGDQTFLKLEIYDKFIFDLWMIVMIIIKKKWQSNPQRLGNTIEIEEKKKGKRPYYLHLSKNVT